MGLPQQCPASPVLCMVVLGEGIFSLVQGWQQRVALLAFADGAYLLVDDVEITADMMGGLRNIPRSASIDLQPVKCQWLPLPVTFWCSALSSRSAIRRAKSWSTGCVRRVEGVAGKLNFPTLLEGWVPRHGPASQQCDDLGGCGAWGRLRPGKRTEITSRRLTFPCCSGWHREVAEEAMSGMRFPGLEGQHSEAL